MSERAARVARVLAIGARIADAADSLGREARARLVETSGLSREGIELALDEHLERGASVEVLAAFVDSAAEARACRVVLSANVCVAALRAIAFATATAPEIAVVPSRRDPVVAELVVRELGDDAAFSGQARLSTRDESATEGELHVYGSDEAIAALRATTTPSVLVRGHGSGLGAALIGAAIDLDEAAAALARDVVPFDQAGCLSPRFALVSGGSARAEHFAASLAAALEKAGTAIPRGEIDEATRGELVRYRAATQAVGVFHEGRHHAVGFDGAPRALYLPPAARVVHVAASEGADVRRLLEPFARVLTSVGVTDTESADLVRGYACRIAELGRMQKPPFDGPVDLRPYRSPA